ncbi:hypothetical protein VIGAN_06023600 [Vigna angularis var. angularis]|uniref:Uncharacterized protein n=1 Tax=Vigna angularis var. angularis TaxID=157739 RepID=A0A0S3S8Z6_PHAAN|nr:hypothetical protein VIGAN_06023600 [Vigna angularis var. angularis]
MTFVFSIRSNGAYFCPAFGSVLRSLSRSLLPFLPLVPLSRSSTARPNHPIYRSSMLLPFLPLVHNFPPTARPDHPSSLQGPERVTIRGGSGGILGRLVVEPRRFPVWSRVPTPNLGCARRETKEEKGSDAAEEVVARKLARRSGDAVAGGSGEEEARRKRKGDPGVSVE